MLEELHAWVMQNGGSPFARKILEQAKLNDGKEVPAQVEPQPSPAQEAEPAADGSASAEENCPHWMHHRKGVFCKACGRTP